MRPSGMHYFPLTWPFVLGLLLVLLVVVALVELHVLRYAYERVGISRRYVYALLLLSLLGSYVNIPVAELPGQRVISNTVVEFYGVRYVVPAVEDWPRTVIAVNVGGALIPTCLSLYLLFKNQLFARALAGVLIVTLVVHHFAVPVKGVGINVPVFLPPLVAAGVALILGGGRAPALAYIAGSMGTLIGADLMNLDKIRGLDAPIASIGGAGTFDGVFLSGILGVLLAPGGAPPSKELEPAAGADDAGPDTEFMPPPERP